MLDFIDRCHSLSSLLLPQAALTSLPYAAFFGYFLVRTQESDTVVILKQLDKLKFEEINIAKSFPANFCRAAF